MLKSMKSIVLIVGSTELCTLKNVLKISYIYYFHVCIYDACMIYVCMHVCIMAQMVKNLLAM